MIIIYIILLFCAIVFYTIPIVKSRTIYKDDDHPAWMENLIWIATASITLIFFVGALDYLISSNINAVNTISTNSIWYFIKEITHIFGGLKWILIIYLSSQIASLVISYVVISTSNSFKELRQGLIFLAGIFLIVIIILIVGFELFTKRVASVLGIISTVIGIFISLKTLSKHN